MPNDFDPFAVTSGLPDNYIGAISGSQFKYDADMQAQDDGSPQLVLTFTLTPVEDPDIQPYDMKVKTGKGWEVVEDGRRVQREDGKQANYHQNSGAGLLVSYAVDAAGDTMKDYYSATGLTPYDAEFWDGWVFRWDRVKINYGGDIGEIEKLLPAEFINAPVQGGGAGNISQPQPAPVAAAPPAPATPSVPAAKTPAAKGAQVAQTNGNGQGELTKGIPTTTYNQLFELAYNAPDHNAFLETAYAGFGQQGQAVMTVIDDQTEDSVWNSAVAKWNTDNNAA